MAIGYRMLRAKMIPLRTRECRPVLVRGIRPKLDRVWDNPSVFTVTLNFHLPPQPEMHFLGEVLPLKCCWNETLPTTQPSPAGRFRCGAEGSACCAFAGTVHNSRNSPMRPCVCRVAWFQLIMLMCLAKECWGEPGESAAPDLSAGIQRLKRSGYKTHHPSRDREPPTVYLFIGVPIISPRKRAEVRETWGRVAAQQDGIVLRFFMEEQESSTTEDECVGEAPQESRCSDTVYIGRDFLSGNTLFKGQDGVTQKVYLLFEYAVTHFEPAFVMKADDDTFINIPVVLAVLARNALDRTPLYFGHVVEGCIPYCAGPAYVISGAAIHALVAANNIVGLPHYYHEDVVVGRWLSGFLMHILGEEEAGVTIVHSFDVEKEPVPAEAAFCSDADRPLVWIHGLKGPGNLQAVMDAARPCISQPVGLEFSAGDQHANDLRGWRGTGASYQKP